MRILVALDKSDPGSEALEYALTEHPTADITVLHVINPVDGSFGEDIYAYEYVIDAKREAAEELIAEAEAIAEDHGVDIQSAVVVGQPSREIVDYAESNGFDRIIIGSHGRSGVSRVLLGSVAEQVVRRAPIPVTIIR